MNMEPFEKKSGFLLRLHMEQKSGKGYQNVLGIDVHNK